MAAHTHTVALEDLRTWHTGIGHLRREPQYPLHLPLTQQVAA